MCATMLVKMFFVVSVAIDGSHGSCDVGFGPSV